MEATLLAVLSAIGLFQGTTWVMAWRYKWALQIVSLAVTFVYKNYVKPAKALSSDGKLTEEQKSEAVEMAKTKALELAKAKGIRLDEANLDLWIEQAVAKAKGVVK